MQPQQQQHRQWMNWCEDLQGVQVRVAFHMACACIWSKNVGRSGHRTTSLYCHDLSCGLMRPLLHTGHYRISRHPSSSIFRVALRVQQGSLWVHERFYRIALYHVVEGRESPIAVVSLGLQTGPDSSGVDPRPRGSPEGPPIACQKSNECASPLTRSHTLQYPSLP